VNNIALMIAHKSAMILRFNCEDFVLCGLIPQREIGTS